MHLNDDDGLIISIQNFLRTPRDSTFVLVCSGPEMRGSGPLLLKCVPTGVSPLFLLYINAASGRFSNVTSVTFCARDAVDQ